MKFTNCLRHVRCLREDRVFELRRVGDEGIERCDAAYGSVEMLEQLVGNAGCDLGPIAE